MSQPALHRIRRIPIHRIRLMPTIRRRFLLHLVAVSVVLLALIPQGQSAHAAGSNCVDLVSTSTGATQTLCGLGPSTPPAPPALLNPSVDPYVTDAQVASLQTLEAQAITTTISDHGLPTSDSDAVKSWGRSDAQAELYALIVKAIGTSASSRTPDQQNAVDWVAGLEKKEAAVAGREAGREYVRWAGLDQKAYQALVDNPSTTQGDLQSFLSTAPEPFNGTAISDSTGGYCVYQPPKPYSAEYNDSTDRLCFQSGGLGCLFDCAPASTPTYDQFVRWGEADASNALLSSTPAVVSSSAIAAGLIFGGAAVGAGVGGLTLSTGLASALVGTSLQQAILPYALAVEEGAGNEAELEVAVTAVEEEAAAGEVAGSVGGVAGVLIAAISAAVIEGINVTNAAALPGKLATLITNSEATPDPATLLQSSDGTTTLFSLFVTATLPLPGQGTCDSSSTGYACLNPTPIPPATGADPSFLIQWDRTGFGFTHSVTASTITWMDVAQQKTTRTARVSGNWFIVQPQGATTPAQQLEISYTDWFGDEEVAWLVNGPSGYRFVGYDATLGNEATTTTGVPASAHVPLNPATCRTSGICWTSSAIGYVGADGTHYQASVQSPGAPAPSGTPAGPPSYTDAVYGSTTDYVADPAVFAANNFAVPGFQTAYYTWEFQQNHCTFGGCPTTPNYTTPIKDYLGTAYYTWQTAGTYAVRLTAVATNGSTAAYTFHVRVVDIPPYFNHLNVNNGLPWGKVGVAASVSGSIYHAGTQEDEAVTVDWGDGQKDTAAVGPDAPLVGGSTPSFTLTPASSKTSASFSDTHAYARPGLYKVTMSVADVAGGTASQTYTLPVVPAGATALIRYYSPRASSHWVTTGPVSQGYNQEQILPVYMHPTGSFTSPLYGCLYGTSEHFLSRDPGCDGQIVLRTEGYVSSAAVPGGVALYRCYTGRDHFVSTDAKCEGATTGPVLGYIPTWTTRLIRYYAPSTTSHWVTTGPVSQGYNQEQILGYADPLQQGPFASPLYGCLHGANDHFLSRDPACEGWIVLRTEGYVADAAVPGGVALYRCNTGRDHFVSTDAKCEGATTESMLGYVVTSPAS